MYKSKYKSNTTKRRNRCQLKPKRDKSVESINMMIRRAQRRNKNGNTQNDIYDKVIYNPLSSC